MLDNTCPVREMHPASAFEKLRRLGLRLGEIGLAALLIIGGAAKFGPVEAAHIRPLVERHPGMAWLYGVASEQTVSVIFGIPEILIGLGLLISFWIPKLASPAAFGACLVFLSTLSFLIWLPPAAAFTSGSPINAFFILKDLVLLSTALGIFARGWPYLTESRLTPASGPNSLPTDHARL